MSEWIHTGLIPSECPECKGRSPGKIQEKVIIIERVIKPKKNKKTMKRKNPRKQ